MKICSGCKVEMTSHNAHRREIARPSGKCRPCLAEKAKKYRQTNNDALNKKRREYYRRNIERWRDQNLKQNYGLSLAEWEALFDAQGRKCCICGVTETSGRGWQTDHNHSNGVVRGILCHHCNSLLGHAKESETILSSAIDYIKTHNRADHKPENRLKKGGKAF